VIGGTRLVAADEDHHEFSCGLGESYWRKGYAKEAI